MPHKDKGTRKATTFLNTVSLESFCDQERIYLLRAVKLTGGAEFTLGRNFRGSLFNQMSRWVSFARNLYSSCTAKLLARDNNRENTCQVK